MQHFNVRGFTSQGVILEDDPDLINPGAGPIELEEERYADLVDVTTDIKLKAERKKHYDED